MSEWPSFSYVDTKRGVFTGEECDELIATAKEAGFRSGQLGATRSCRVAWISARNPLIERLASYRWSGDIRPTEIFSGSAQVSVYGPDDGYAWHMDLGSGPMSLRKLTVVLELQSAPQGGGLEVFAIGNLNLQRGDVAILPSFIMHRALPVISGERWSAVVWLLGDEPFR